MSYLKEALTCKRFSTQNVGTKSVNMATSDLVFDGELLDAEWFEGLFKAMSSVCTHVTLKLCDGEMEFAQLNDSTSAMAQTKICTRAWSQYTLASDLTVCEVSVDLKSLLLALRVLHATPSDTLRIYIPNLQDCIHFKIIRGGRTAHFELKALCQPTVQQFPDLDEFASDVEVMVYSCDFARAINQMKVAMCYSNYFSLIRTDDDSDWLLLVVSDDDDSNWQVTAEMNVLEINHHDNSRWTNVNLQSPSFNVDLIRRTIGANKMFKHVKVCFRVSTRQVLICMAQISFSTDKPVRFCWDADEVARVTCFVAPKMSDDEMSTPEPSD